MPKGKEYKYFDFPTSDASSRKMQKGGKMEYKEGGFLSKMKGKLKKAFKPISQKEAQSPEHKAKVRAKAKAVQTRRVEKRKKFISKAKKALKPISYKESRSPEYKAKVRAKSKAVQAKRVAKRKEVVGKVKKAFKAKPVSKPKKAKKRNVFKIPR